MRGLLLAIAPAIVAVQGQSPGSTVVDGIAIPAGWAVAAMTPSARADASKTAPTRNQPAAKEPPPQVAGGAARALQFVVPVAGEVTPGGARPTTSAAQAAAAATGYPPLPQPAGDARLVTPATQAAAVTVGYPPLPQPAVVAVPVAAAPVALHAVVSSGIRREDSRKKEAPPAPAPVMAANASSSNATAPAPAPVASPGTAPATPDEDLFVPAADGVLVPPASEVMPAQGATPVMAKAVLDKIVSVECLQKTLKDAAYVCDDTHYVGGPPPPPPPPAPKAKEQDAATVNVAEVMAAVNQAKQYAEDAREASAKADKAAAKAEQLAEKLGQESEKTGNPTPTITDDSKKSGDSGKLFGIIPGVGSFVAKTGHPEVKHAPFKLVLHKKPPLVMHKKRRPSLLHNKR